MKLGSLFDGSGGFPLAGSLCGIEPAWASEVEPYPIAVTRSRFPNMKHLGDISKINGAEVEPVDNRMAVAHMVLDDQGGSSINVRTDGKAPTLRAETHGNLPCVMEAAGFKPNQGAKAMGIGWEKDISPTLLAGQEPGVCIKIYDSRGNGDGDTVSTLTGDHENRITDYTSVVVEKQPVYCLQGNTIDRPAVAYENRTYACTTGSFMQVTEEVAPTLMARDWKDPTCVATRYIVRRLTPTECARLQGFADRWGDIDPKIEFSDADYRFWLEVRNTHATVIGGKEAKEYTKEQMLKWYNGLQTDSAEYKMWGNGIALPPALYVLQGITDALNAYADEPFADLEEVEAIRAELEAPVEEAGAEEPVQCEKKPQKVIVRRANRG